MDSKQLAQYIDHTALTLLLKKQNRIFLNSVMKPFNTVFIQSALIQAIFL